jgi:VWFA-related protein
MMSFSEARRLPSLRSAARCIYSLFFGICVLWSAILGSESLAAQSTSPPTAAAAPASQPDPQREETNQASAEITAHDEPATFKVNVKLVVVRAVVRDAQGHAIGNLRKEDFQVFDKGKLQVISQFEVEQPGDLTVKARRTSEQNSSESVAGEPAPSIDTGAVPERFVAYLFDDVHMQFGDLVHVREAAERQFATLRPSDRAAIFTTSGQNNLDYTDDRTKLHATLLSLMPRPIASHDSSTDCPDISYYQADQIFNQHDPQANQVATQEALSCPEVASLQPSQAAQVAAGLVTAKTQLALLSGDQESHIALAVLKQVVLNISRMPGQRNVVLVSPGFIAPLMQFDYSDIIDRAVRSQVVINTLNARGLYTIDTLGDIASPPQVAPPPQKGLIVIAAANANDDILAALADGTGGVFFHNSNDYDAGFRQTAQAPEYSYVLAFTPQDLKLDGNYHPLKVSLKNPQKLTVQARRGYFAPRHLADPNEQAKREIEEAMYSQDEMHNLPVKLHTQFFKASDTDAKLIVLAHVDVQRMHYKKADGRNSDVLTCVSAVFNRNGNFLQGLEKTVTMHWKDATLEHKLGPGITLKSSFDVKPGSYLVRLVVRDSEGQLMSAENGTVEIR